MISSNILLWHKDIGYVRINEGTGDNLLEEDTEKGYVDYIMLDFLEYDGLNFSESEGAQVMLTELFQSKFESETEVVKYLIDTNWIPDVEYTYLYMGNGQ